MYAIAECKAEKGPKRCIVEELNERLEKGQERCIEEELNERLK